ncbi:CST complex subunit TEN1 isoform 2-T2 [Thomomys bottae]
MEAKSDLGHSSWCPALRAVPPPPRDARPRPAGRSAPLLHSRRAARDPATLWGRRKRRRPRRERPRSRRIPGNRPGEAPGRLEPRGLRNLQNSICEGCCPNPGFITSPGRWVLAMFLTGSPFEHLADVGFVVKARVLTCVEGINLPLLERAVQEQRLYLQERDSCQYETSSPSSPHLLPHSSQSHCPPQPAPQATPTPLVATALYRSLPAS